MAWGLAEKIVVQGHDRKTCGDGDRVDPADRIDQWRIFLVAASECLEGALEAVDQVYGQGEDTDKVDGHDPYFLEGDIDAAVDILHGFIMAGVGDHGELVCKAHLDPEVAHVEAEEGEDEDAEEALEAEDEGWIANVVSEFRKKFAVQNHADHAAAQQQAGHRLSGLAGTGRCSRRR